jgi:hypothetical protein
MDISIQIKKLRTLVTDVINENEIAVSGEGLLQDLRREWKRNREDFSGDQIQELKALANKVKLIRSFVDEMDDVKYIRTQEEARETIQRFSKLVIEFEGTVVLARIYKEIREIKEIKPTLERELDIINRRDHNKLLSKAPKCTRCGNMMILQSGNYGHFWGCSNYPNCYGTKNLSEDELQLLP